METTTRLCSICGETFASDEELEQHLESSHADEAGESELDEDTAA